MPRREFSRTVKAQIVHRAMSEKGQIVCEGCGLVLAGKRFEIDHTIPDAMFLDKNRELTADDGRLLGLECCHRPKTAKDRKDIAKVRRQEAKHRGFKRKSRPLPAGRDSEWKIKIGGEVVRR